MNPAWILLNPASGGGAARRRWARLEPRLRGIFDQLTVVMSAEPGQLAAAARELAASAEPIDILAAGGDGTSHEVLNGIMAGGPRMAAMGWIPIGSGNDLARSVGILPGTGPTIRALSHARRSALDVGTVEIGSGHHRRRTAFGNSFTLGLSASVLEHSQAGGKAWGGRLAYLAATLRALTGPLVRPFRIAVDGAPPADSELCLLAVTNGPTIGAGMRVAPGGLLDDGTFELTRVGPLSRAAAFGLFPRIYWGGHLHHPAVHQERIRRLEVLGDGPVAFELDGELIRGSLPLSVTINPGGLTALRPAAPAPG